MEKDYSVQIREHNMCVRWKVDRVVVIDLFRQKKLKWNRRNTTKSRLFCPTKLLAPGRLYSLKVLILEKALPENRKIKQRSVSYEKVGFLRVKISSEF